MNRVSVGKKVILENGVYDLLEEVDGYFKIRGVLTGHEDIVSTEFIEWNGIFPEDTLKVAKSDILNF